jgi:N-acetylmuramoyl-L-alanine amidase
MNHETQGHGSGQWYRDFFSCPSGQRCNDALVDYVITRDGVIYRLNDPGNDRSPWANGGPLGLEGDGPAFYARFGASGINNALISIEYEKLDSEGFTDAQVQAGGFLNAYWHDQDNQDWEAYPYVPRYGCVTSLAHFEIGTTNCGTGELDDISRVQAVARGEMKRWQTLAEEPGEPIPPSVPPQPEIPEVLGGLSLEEASRRFGTLVKHTPDGKTKPAPFDRRGVISLCWLHRCVETGEWPRAEDWWALSDSGGSLDIVTFSNDWQLIRVAERQGLMWANFAEIELDAA